MKMEIELEDSVFKNDIGGMMSLELESKDEKYNYCILVVQI